MAKKSKQIIRQTPAHRQRFFFPLFCCRKTSLPWSMEEFSLPLWALAFPPLLCSLSLLFFFPSSESPPPLPIIFYPLHLPSPLSANTIISVVVRCISVVVNQILFQHLPPFLALFNAQPNGSFLTIALKHPIRCQPSKTLTIPRHYRK